MLYLRELVYEAASEISLINSIEETLRWGKPSYITKIGSTLRMDWKEKTSNQYALYFKCTSKLVPTFKNVFGGRFQYEGTRAIIFKLDEEIPKEEVKLCIKTALSYHKIKHLENLGMV